MIESFRSTSSTSESRFRAACDRCHELKNRCARRQGTDSRCERCERLELDCVYSTGARMGRPPGPQGKQQSAGVKDNNYKPEAASSRSAAHATRGGGAALNQGGRSSQTSSSSPSRGGDQSQLPPPAPKRRRHHHRRQTQSSGVGVGSYHSSHSETMELMGTGMTPLESTSSSSGSVVQGSSILLSPQDSGANSWLETQDGVAVSRSMDWDHEMTSLATEQAHLQWPSKTTTEYDTAFSGMLEGHDSLPGAQENISFLFQEPTDRHMMFTDAESRKQQLFDAGSRMPLLKDAGHSSSTLEKLMRLQDELRDLVASQALLPAKPGPGEPRRQHHSLNSGLPGGTEDDEAIQATLSLLTIVHELLLTPPASGSGSPSSGEEYFGAWTPDDPSHQGPRAFLHEAVQVKDPAFHPGSSAASQTAMLQVLNCYTYLLQLLDLTACRLKGQIEQQQQQHEASAAIMVGQRSQAEVALRATITSGGRQNAVAEVVAPSFQIGCVSLDLFPALNAELVLYALMRIVKRIHGMVDLLAFGRTFPTGQDDDKAKEQQQQQQQASGAYGPPRMGDGPTVAAAGGGFSSPVIIAARAVMGAVYEKEKALVARMGALANGESPIHGTSNDLRSE